MTDNRVQEFRTLHRSGHLFILPNAWSTASALVMEMTGFPAIGTTSWGIAASLGYQDGEVISFTEMLFIVKHILARIRVPVTVDLEAGYGTDPKEIAEHVRTVAALGASGINIEDMAYGASPKLRSIEQQTTILHAIRAALSPAGYDLFVNARIDTYLSGTVSANTIIDETIRRGQAYVEAGADGVFVPGARDASHIAKLCKAIPAPLNILALPDLTDTAALTKLGVVCLSLGKAAYNKTLDHLQAISYELLTHHNVCTFFDRQHQALNLSQHH